MDRSRPDRLVDLVPVPAPVKRPRRRQGPVGLWGVALFPPSGALLTYSNCQQVNDEGSWFVKASQLSHSRHGILTRHRAFRHWMRLAQPKLTDIATFLANLTTVSKTP